MNAAKKVIPSGITPKVNYDAEILRKAREICDLISNMLGTFLLDLTQLQHDAIGRLEEWTPTERLMTVEEVAIYIGFTKRTVESWTSPGREPLIRFRMIGGEKRFRKAWVDEAIDNGSVKPRERVKL